MRAPLPVPRPAKEPSPNAPAAKRWIFREAEPAPAHLNRWADELSISPLLAGILWQRGLRDPQAMDRYLNPGLRWLAPPTAIPGLDQAASVLAREVDAGKRIAVWGDYDADGVTASALVKEFLELRGVACGHHIPDRQTEGYGLNVPGIEQLAAQGIQTIITVDCGISDMEPVERAKELGLTVVVSDHHLPGKDLPKADGLCNPRLGTERDPDGIYDLAGVGVAFYLMAALNKLLPGEPLDMRQFLDLVALGTLADVVPLSPQNRILTKNGLLLIAEAARPGMAALKEASDFAVSAALGSGQVSFTLAPRINAAGRLERAEQALDLLLAPDMETARPLAARLDSLNRERRAEEDSILESALAQAEEQVQDQSPALVLVGEDWHPGVIGIVASRVVEAHYRPTFLFSHTDKGLKGSGRSISECNIFEALCACKDLLAEFGGHRMAAGAGLAPDNLESFRERFTQAVVDQIGKDILPPKLKLDQELGFDQVEFTLLKELELMQPFGPGNPEPVFASGPVTVQARRVFGKGKEHVNLDLKDEACGITLQGKAWRSADKLGKDLVGKNVRIGFSPKIDRFNGLARIDLTIKDLQVV